MREKYLQKNHAPGECPGFGMVDPLEGYWFTPCVRGESHWGPHKDSEGYSRYPLKKRIMDRKIQLTHQDALGRWVPDE